MPAHEIPSQREPQNPLTYLGSSTLPELGGRTVPIYQWVNSREYIVGSGHPVSPDIPPHERADLVDLQPGTLYVDSDTGWTVRFLGRARMEELGGEVVGICQVVDQDVFLIPTLQSYRLGERLTHAD